jgi:Niemann-Pick C1 protein
MQFIGGGAKNFQDFLTFLGHKSALGSPFQINFPRPDEDKFPGLVAADDEAHPCNSTDTRYRCACMDCGSSCAMLPEVTAEHGCYVGHWPCLSFAVVLVYCIFVMMLVLAVTGHVYYRKRAQNMQERLRLLQDTTLDDDDDDSEIIYQPGVIGRPTRPYWPNTVCNRMFSRLGLACARFPAITIGTCVVVIALLNIGWMHFEIETDPVRLWVSPDSDAAAEKTFFDGNFGPFFRAEQAFLVNDTLPTGPGPVLSFETLQWWFSIEDKVKSIKSPDGKVTFKDVCYNPTGEGCVVQSLSGFYQAGLDRDDWDEQLSICVDNPVEGTCLPDFGQPLDINLLVGPYNHSVFDTQALVATWVVTNHEEGTPEVERSIAWEQSLKALMLDVQLEAKERGLRLSFNTESSLEQELNKSTNTDAKIVVISYILMFLYASIALGSTTLAVKSILQNPTRALVQSKFMVGVVGIIIVLLSVSASIGLFSACGIKVTLIIAEVIPFLVLAVGVDNIFLLVHEFERVNASHPDEKVEYRMSKALGHMGPSILLSATMETIAFALGTAVGMPAVRNFAAYAAGAVLINAVLQVTMFVSVLALNQRRVEAGRVDCVPCVRVQRPASAFYGQHPPVHDEDTLQRFIRRIYAPALLGSKAKVVIMTIFLGLLTCGIALLPSIELGLDQRIAIPTDSYMIDYFNDLYSYFNAGPPVYFVTKELNITQRMHQQQLCGRFSTCDAFSLTNILEGERKRPEVSYIAAPAASWVDDFFLWLNPNLGEECCVNPKTGEPCFADRDPAWNITLSGMPEGYEYMSYLERWLAAPTNADCPLAGKAAYSDAVVVNNTTLTIPASHFRTSHTPLRSQSDFIEAYASARRIASSIQDANPGVTVFPYSKFYIFFDQYSSIVRLTMALLGSAVAVCFLVSSLLLGSLRTGAVISVTVIMTLVDIGGAMAVAGVSLNAVTLVNLVICVGIAVEFCAHIARAFQFPSARLIGRAAQGISVTQLVLNGKNVLGERKFLSLETKSVVLRGNDARAWAAMTQVGGSVFSGITITKLLGVSVLAFTRSKIFEIYYFRVWLALVIFAALHALVFLPVALSWFGDDCGYAEPEADGDGLEENLRRRRWDALGEYRDEGDDSEDDGVY